MKKKIWITGIIALLLIGTAIATTFNTKLEAITYFDTMKDTIETSITKISNTIEITTDKVCMIDYYSEKTICSICFRYEGSENNSCIVIPENTILDEDNVCFTYEGSDNCCIILPEDNTLAEDNLAIEKMAKENIAYDMPREEVSYTARIMKDNTLSISEEITEIVKT